MTQSNPQQQNPQKQPSKQQHPLKRKPLKNQLPNRQIKFSTKSTEPLPQSPLSTPLQFKPTQKSKIKQYESIENVSLIQGSSFISNKQDGSMDSMDKMIIGVSAMGIGEKEFQEDGEDDGDGDEGREKEEKEDKEDGEKSKGSGIDFDFNQIHKQYERLIGRNQLLGEDEEEGSDQIDENSRVLPDEDDWQIKQSSTLQKKLQKLSLSLSPKKPTQILQSRLQKLQQKLDELSPKKSLDNPNINNSIKILVGNLGNLSQIHQQRQNNVNISGVDIQRNQRNQRNQRKRKNNNGNGNGEGEGDGDGSQEDGDVGADGEVNANQEDQQEFIDFVRQPDPGRSGREGENQGENLGEGEGIGNQWEVTPMFEHHLELQLQNEKKSNKTKQKLIPTNYQQILQDLNSKQQAQILQYNSLEKIPHPHPHPHSSHSSHQNPPISTQPPQPHQNPQLMNILSQRQNWIKLQIGKSEKWRKKQLVILEKMRKIFGDPFYESQDQDREDREDGEDGGEEDLEVSK